MKKQVKVSIAMILADLENGLTRPDIGEKYGLIKADVSRMFDHEDLKGKKTKAKPGFVFVEEGEESTPEEIQEITGHNDGEEATDKAEAEETVEEEVVEEEAADEDSVEEVNF